MKKAPTETQH